MRNARIIISNESGIFLKRNRRKIMKTFLAADTAHGVYRISESEIDGEILTGDDFLASLSGCSDGETLFGIIESSKLLEKIDAEYGIN